MCKTVENKYYINEKVTARKIIPRLQTLLCFMYASGMRAEEMCDLTVGDIPFYQDRARVNVYGEEQKYEG